MYKKTAVLSPVESLMAGCMAILLAVATTSAVARPDEDVASRYAALALDCVEQEYPNLIHHVMTDDDDVAPPRELTPAFYGCFDWHSSVHGHWMLSRLARLYPGEAFSDGAIAALGRNLTEQALLAEAAYVSDPSRTGFERPYGLAWLLQLVAELDQWDHPEAIQWRKNLEPLESIAVRRIRNWLPKLAYPIRSGEHSQTAFAFGLFRDYAVQVGNREFRLLIDRTARDFYLSDRDCPLAYEPSGHDFLSPCLAEADLMRRVLPEKQYAEWLSRFLPTIGDEDWLPVATVTDRADGKLAHLDGLNLSRAWMLEGIADGLPDDDPRRAALLETARTHAESGLAGVSGEHYAGGHWLASFAVYLETGRGL